MKTHETHCPPVMSILTFFLPPPDVSKACIPVLDPCLHQAAIDMRGHLAALELRMKAEPSCTTANLVEIPSGRPCVIVPCGCKSLFQCIMLLGRVHTQSVPSTRCTRPTEFFIPETLPTAPSSCLAVLPYRLSIALVVKSSEGLF